MNDEPMTEQQIAEALGNLYKKGFIDIFINEDGEWIYKPTKLGLEFHKQTKAKEAQ
jgi:hypothetical protein